MSVQAGEELYNAHILALAGDMPRAGRLAHPQAAADVENRLCGSACMWIVLHQKARHRRLCA